MVLITMQPVQCKMARTALGWGVRELAEAAKVSPDTIARFERGETLRERTIALLRAVMETAGVEFISENGGGPWGKAREGNKHETGD